MKLIINRGEKIMDELETLQALLEEIKEMNVNLNREMREIKVRLNEFMNK